MENYFDAPDAAEQPHVTYCRPEDRGPRGEPSEEQRRKESRVASQVAAEMAAQPKAPAVSNPEALTNTMRLLKAKEESPETFDREFESLTQPKKAGSRPPSSLSASTDSPTTT